MAAGAWLLATLALPASTAPLAPPNPGDAEDGGRPYLKRSAATTAALARQVEGDAQLTARYCKHFRVAPAAVWDALRTARPLTLPPDRYTVWLTGRDGLRYPTEQERPEPTRAFLVALRSPEGYVTFLEAGTGNPMEPFRPAERVVVSEVPAPARVVEVAVPTEVLVPVGRADPQVPAGDAALASAASSK